MNRIALGLTRLWLRLLGAKFLRISPIRLSANEDQKIIVFSSKKCFLLGQVTPFGTTIIHEIVFQSERLTNYAVKHEYAHRRQWYRYFIYPPAMALAIALAPLAVFLIITLVSAILSFNPLNLLVPFQVLLIILLLFAIPCLYSWLLELNADCYAIRELGIQYVLDAINDAHQLAEKYGFKKPDLLQRIIGRMTHPPISLTYRVCRFFHRREFNTDSLSG